MADSERMVGGLRCREVLERLSDYLDGDLGPAEVARVSIPLGSITVDGVSLTVNAIPAPGCIQLSLIPFTFGHTTLGDKTPGAGVHLEGDTIGKYVASLLQNRRA